MNSVERMQRYHVIPVEAAAENHPEEGDTLPLDWPSRGQVEFRQARYAHDLARPVVSLLLILRAYFVDLPC
jgi:hypothetical protein